MSADDLRDRRLLVLGAGGFVGRRVVVELQRRGGEPVAVVRDASVARGGPLTGRVVSCDLVDLAAVEALIEAERPDVLFNLAGYGVGPDEGDEPTAQRINADLVAAVGRALGRLCPVGDRPALVHAGSAFEYGAVGGDLAEDGPAEPTSVYGRTKLEGTRHVARLGRQGVVHGVTARLFTVYGPGERPHRLLPSLIEAAQRREPVDLTEGLQRRDFTFVDDVAEGLCRLAAAPGAPGAPGEVINLATGALSAVRGFVEAAARVLGIPAENLRFGAVPSRPDEMAHDPPTVSRLRQRTGWTPSTTLADGVRRTWESDILERRGNR